MNSVVQPSSNAASAGSGETTETFSPSRLGQTIFAPHDLGRLRCAIVGTGALGSEVARLLGQLGLGEVDLIDPDTIAAVNRPHSIFFCGDAEVGEAKVAAIARQGAALFPRTAWTPVQKEIADVPLAALSGVDLLFSCPDNAVARSEAAHSARRLGKPTVDLALLGESWWRGRVAVFPAGLEAACYLCQFTEQFRSELLSHTVSSNPGCSSRPSSPELASTPVMASSIAALAVDTGLRHLLCAPARTLPEGERTALEVAFAVDLTLAGSASRWETHLIPRSATCPWHEPDLQGSLRELPGPGETVADLLREEQATALSLEWPLVARARCLVCGGESSPLTRVAAFRSGSLCHCCGATNLLPVETISEIHRDSSVGQRALSDFGLSLPCLASVR